MTTPTLKWQSWLDRGASRDEAPTLLMVALNVSSVMVYLGLAVYVVADEAFADPYLQAFVSISLALISLYFVPGAPAVWAWLRKAWPHRD